METLKSDTTPGGQNVSWDRYDTGTEDFWVVDGPVTYWENNPREGAIDPRRKISLHLDDTATLVEVNPFDKTRVSIHVDVDGNREGRVTYYLQRALLDAIVAEYVAKTGLKSVTFS